MKKIYFILGITFTLLFLVFSILQYRTVNANNNMYTIQKDNFPSNRTFQDLQGIKYHVLQPLKPIKYFDPYNGRETVTLILPLDITNTKDQTIDILSNSAIENTLFYAKLGDFYNLIPYSMELPDKYKFDSVIPPGKTVRGYIGTKYFLGDDPNRAYKSFTINYSKVSFIYFSKGKNGKYHELEIPIN